MDESLLIQIDNIYEKYGYEVKKNHNGARVYVFTKSIYNGADILRINDNGDIDSIKKYYSEEGYAVKVKKYDSIDDAKNELFKDFFKTDGVIKSLQRKYKKFVYRLMDRLPNEAEYQYINCPYEYILYSDNRLVSSEIPSTYDDVSTLVSKVVSMIRNHSGPLFVVIEAAAGYGKTCTV